MVYDRLFLRSFVFLSNIAPQKDVSLIFLQDDLLCQRTFLQTYATVADSTHPHHLRGDCDRSRV
jgi:hypothetical protein